MSNLTKNIQTSQALKDLYGKVYDVAISPIQPSDGVYSKVTISDPKNSEKQLAITILENSGIADITYDIFYFTDAEGQSDRDLEKAIEAILEGKYSFQAYALPFGIMKNVQIVAQVENGEITSDSVLDKKKMKQSWVDYKTGNIKPYRFSLK